MCIGCIGTAKQEQEQFSSLHAQAKALAIKTGENVVIYKTEEGLGFMVESMAAREGLLHAGVQFVSPVQPVTA